MKRLYEGASAASVIFFLIVVGGFLFGTKTHKDKSRQNRKVEEKVEKVEKAKRDHHFDDQMHENAEELEYLRKMNDPLWNYYDEEALRYQPIPGKYKEDTPRRPRGN